MDLFIDEPKLPPFIIYVDVFVLYGYHHYPHFIVVLGRKGRKIEILDPWGGRFKKISDEELSAGILLLKKYLGFAPRTILVEK